MDRSRPASSASLRDRAVPVLLALSIAYFAFQVVRTIWVSDDAFITLRTVDNLVHGFGLRWNVAERVQTFTHPLWLAVVTPVYALVRDPYYAVTLVSLATTFVAIFVLVFRSGVPRVHATVAVLALALSKAFVDYSTSGLENPLTHLLVLLLALELLRAAPWDDKALRVGLLGGLLGLNRLDLLLLAAPALAFTLIKVRSHRARLKLLSGLAPLVAWELFAAFYYGSFFPNTTLAKLQTGIPAGELVMQGVTYLKNSLLWDPLTLTATAAGVALALVGRRAGPILLAAGVVLYLAAVVRVGADFMSGRFLTGPFLAAVMLLAAARWPRPAWFPFSMAALVLVLVVLSPRPAWNVSTSKELSEAELVDDSGIADERRYYFRTSGLFSGSPGWRRPTVEATLRARDLGCSQTEIAVEGAVGVTGFYAGRAVHVVDIHALGDPLLARLPMVAADPFFASFMRSWKKPSDRPWRIGHFLRNVPDGYLTTLLAGRNAIKDPTVAQLYERVRLLARAPLLAPGRLSAVLGSSLTIRSWDPASRPPFQQVNWMDVLQVRPDSAEALLNIAAFLYGAQRYREALEAYGGALARCPTHSGALQGAGNAALQLEDYAAAERFGRAAVAAAPAHDGGYVLLSFALRGQRRYQEAAAVLEEIARRNATFGPTALELLGELWLEAGDRDRARDALTRCLAADPERSAARRLLSGLGGPTVGH